MAARAYGPQEADLYFKFCALDFQSAQLHLSSHSSSRQLTAMMYGRSLLFLLPSLSFYTASAPPRSSSSARALRHIRPNRRCLSSNNWCGYSRLSCRLSPPGARAEVCCSLQHHYLRERKQPRWQDQNTDTTCGRCDICRGHGGRRLLSIC